MKKLERYEWCDFWWEETDKDDKPRVLLIGDSITRDYRSTVNELIKEKGYVDMLATSKGIDNPSLIREIDYILGHENFKYKVIHFNNGLHARYLAENEYEKYLEKIVLHIMKNSGNAQIILVKTTPVTKEVNKEEIDQEINTMVLKRNEALEHIAEKYNLLINDLYTPTLGRSEYRVQDGYHYTEMGQKVQAGIVVRKIEELL